MAVGIGAVVGPLVEALLLHLPHPGLDSLCQGGQPLAHGLLCRVQVLPGAPLLALAHLFVVPALSRGNRISKRPKLWALLNYISAVFKSCPAPLFSLWPTFL